MFKTMSILSQGGTIVERLEDEMGQVQSIFASQLASDLPPVNRLCGHIENYRGKMLRPTLALLAGLSATRTAKGSEADTATALEALADNWPLTHAHRVIAAVCEMVHMATLVHDDVLDEAALRRRGSTVNYLQGNEAAVLLGDYLISNAFHLCSTLGRPEINRRIGEVTNTLCAGELLQLHHRRNWSLDQRTYFAIIERKTASLIGVCCELGARESTDDEDVVLALSRYGSRLGMAFQIQDDVLDLVGSEEVVGKTLGQDLDKGKLTLPLILYLEQAEAPKRAALLELLSAQPSDDRSGSIQRMLQESDAVTAAHRVARRLTEEARAELANVPDGPLTSLLNEVAEAVVSRER
ncbi:MAG: polyprenyl synthetase family protein [Planctomycetes bacterium]|nr:polyprenyl synthetase family protein [Planctomycetota bacterium]